MDARGRELFPLSWTRNSKDKHSVQRRALTSVERVEVDRLSSCVTRRTGQLKCSLVLSLVDDAETLIDYLQGFNMATMSAVERQKYREQQKKKQGYVVGSPNVPAVDVDPPRRPGGSPTQASPQENSQPDVQLALFDGAPRPPPFYNPPPAKKHKVGPSYEFRVPLQGESTANVAWKQVLKTQKRVDGQPDSPVWSVFGARYPLNEVLSKAAEAGDVERVQSLEAEETMTAVKSFGHFISVLTHLAEDALGKTVADHSRLGQELKNTEEALEEYTLERSRLKEDVEKYEREKRRLDGVVDSLKADKKRLLDELEQGKKD